MQNMNLVRTTAPILKSFEVKGLYGYKDIRIDFEKNVKIIVDENGVGKTTLLNMLYAVLNKKPERLLEIDFESLHIKFHNFEEITFNKNVALNKYLKIDEVREFFQYFSREGISETQSKSILLKILTLKEDDFYKGRSAWQTFFLENLDPDQVLDLDLDLDFIKYLSRRLIRSNKFDKTYINGFHTFIEQIDVAMGDLSVLYLPTFRRIESELLENSISKNLNKPSKSLGSRRLNSWNNEQLIYFGLNDVKSKLDDICTEMRSKTLNAYSKISASTLDNLLSIKNTDAKNKLQEIDIATLNVILTRLEKSNSETEKSIIELIESGQINDPENNALKFMLNQLVEIYEQTKDSEQSIEDFAKVINSYWSINEKKIEKEFKFDKAAITAQAINKITGEPLSLNALSSGEKQIFSVFARLYLNYGKKYLILIDEPELSLSLEWQKKFLLDIFNAPSCAQLFAITHSPFVFDNELDPYAGSLKIANRKKKADV
ncbi:AAA family ATPase [uncultured Gilliamella sp.]|uniref:AAA family ATPase n=1 Tax=uncultured Gilliamella sp. TaxID=1193505 RepID=UPI0025CE00B9|nr:AAA family ATPase [uncultured Gilliamella sp.]